MAATTATLSKAQIAHLAALQASQDRLAAQQAKVQAARQTVADANAIKAAAIKTRQQQAAVALANLRATNAKTRVDSRIATFQNKIILQGANAGSNVLTPQFQATIANEQTAFKKSIGAQGGVWQLEAPAGIFPQVQNALLAKAGIGQNNSQVAAQLNANASYLTSLVQQNQANPPAAPPPNLPATNPQPTPPAAGISFTPAPSGSSPAAPGTSDGTNGTAGDGGTSSGVPTTTSAVAGLSDTELLLVVGGGLAVLYFVSKKK